MWRTNFSSNFHWTSVVPFEHILFSSFGVQMLVVFTSSFFFRFGWTINVYWFDYYLELFIWHFFYGVFQKVTDISSNIFFGSFSSRKEMEKRYFSLFFLHSRTNPQTNMCMKGVQHKIMLNVKWINTKFDWHLIVAKTKHDANPL